MKVLISYMKQNIKFIIDQIHYIHYFIEKIHIHRRNTIPQITELLYEYKHN